MFDKEVNEYLRDLEIIKTYIFKRYNGFINIKPTIYRLYLNEQMAFLHFYIFLETITFLFSKYRANSKTLI